MSSVIGYVAICGVMVGKFHQQLIFKTAKQIGHTDFLHSVTPLLCPTYFNCSEGVVAGGWSKGGGVKNNGTQPLRCPYDVFMVVLDT